MGEKDTSNADFFKWLREKMLKEENEKNKDRFEPLPLYITIEKPPTKKPTAEEATDSEVLKDTLVDFNIDSSNTDNTIVYKL